MWMNSSGEQRSAPPPVREGMGGMGGGRRSRLEILISTADRELTTALPCAKKRRVNWGAGEAFEKLKRVAEYLQQNPSCSLRSAAINNDIPESVLRRHVTKMKNPEGCTRGRGRPPRSNCPPVSGANSSESNPMLQAIAEYKQGDHKSSIRSAVQTREDRRRQKNRHEFLQTFKKNNPDYMKKFEGARVKGAQSMKYRSITTNIGEVLLQPALRKAAPFFQKLNSIRIPTPQNAKKSNKFDDTCERNKSNHIECNGKNCYYGDKSCPNRRSLRPYLSSCRPRRWPQNDNESNQFELFSMEKIPQGVFIGQYVGKIRKRAESTDLGFYSADFEILVSHDGSELNLKGGSEEEMATYSYLIDAMEEGNLTRFANHCCEPNCELQVWLINEKPQVWLVSLKEIKKNESVTLNYGPNAPSFFKDGVCKCPAECCEYKEGTKDDVSHLGIADRTQTDRTKKDHDDSDSASDDGIHIVSTTPAIPPLLKRNKREIRLLLKEGQPMYSFTGRKTRSSGKKREMVPGSINKLLLEYPFHKDERVLADAASGLKELGGDLLGVEGGTRDARMNAEGTDPSEGDVNNIDSRNSAQIKNLVTITKDDRDRLLPGRCLNDELINLWMCW